MFLIGSDLEAVLFIVVFILIVLCVEIARIREDMERNDLEKTLKEIQATREKKEQRRHSCLNCSYGTVDWDKCPCVKCEGYTEWKEQKYETNIREL